VKTLLASVLLGESMERVAPWCEQQTYRMHLQYDGTDLCGWAKQAGRRTVQGCLEEAFVTVMGRAPGLRVAGRTDAGVHARHQVASVRLPLDIDVGRLARSLNALTPPCIAVTLLEVAPGFDARRHAVSRTYRYFVQLGGVDSPFFSRYVWRVPVAIDVALLEAAAACLPGRRDFTAFTPTETEHVFFERLVVRSEWRDCGCDRLVFEIEANAFLRHMVRTLVGTMIEVGGGTRSVAGFERLLLGGRREDAGPTAPARGLFLWDVSYPLPLVSPA
jgi:tRNA pseudouridine38-40 synthase